MKILIAVIIFSAIILIHELGHFLLAKKNGIVVTEFSLGMGPRLISTEKGGTRYSIKLLPIGGSCAMLGEDTAEEELPGTFNAAPVWGRISVVAAGPVFNFILAFILSVIITGFVGYDPLIELQRIFLKIRFLQILLLCLMLIKEELKINVVLALKSFPI